MQNAFEICSYAKSLEIQDIFDFDHMKCNEVKQNIRWSKRCEVYFFISYSLKPHARLNYLELNLLILCSTPSTVIKLTLGNLN